MLRKPPHLMTSQEIADRIYQLSGLKPLLSNATQKEQNDYYKVIKIRLSLLMEEKERRMNETVSISS